jgi:23S rRNA G2445 N2-methylase RlmL
MKIDYSAYASGQVFYSRPGFTAFPVRVASAIFSKSVALLKGAGHDGPYVLYDPCCGSAQLLVTLGFLYGDVLSRIVGSDISTEAIDLAEKNIALLTQAGLEKRIHELKDLINQFDKESHRAALQHAISFQKRLQELQRLNPMKTNVFQADVLDRKTVWAGLGAIKTDLVITDIPYGQGSSWSRNILPHERCPAEQMLETLLPFLSRHAVVAVASNRKQKAQHSSYVRKEMMKVGKRRVVFLSPNS